MGNSLNMKQSYISTLFAAAIVSWWYKCIDNFVLKPQKLQKLKNGNSQLYPIPLSVSRDQIMSGAAASKALMSNA